jgi:DNA-directed RNA polymerase specialized sigma24 family protein
MSGQAAADGGAADRPVEEGIDAQAEGRWDEFEEFYRSTYAELVALLEVVRCDSAEAHAAAQYAYSAAWQQWDTVRLDRHGRSWVRRVALAAPARPWRRGIRPARDSGPSRLLAELHRLPLVQRHALVMRDMAGLEPESIAAEEGVTPATVERRLALAELALARALEARGFVGGEQP